MAKLYWEDFEIGDVREFGRHEVTKDEVVEFGREFDPQPFHVDEQAAAESPYGGLIASGWQTCGFFMRMLVDNTLREAHSMGSPGVEWLRWRKPVRPGDVLRLQQEVVDKKPSRNHANLGHVKNRFRMFNQDDEMVLEMESFGMFLRREAASA